MKILEVTSSRAFADMGVMVSKPRWVVDPSAELPQVGVERQFRVMSGTPDTPRLGSGSLSDNRAGPGVGHLNLNAWMHQGPT